MPDAAVVLLAAATDVAGRASVLLDVEDPASDAARTAREAVTALVSATTVRQGDIAERRQAA